MSLIFSNFIQLFCMKNLITGDESRLLYCILCASCSIIIIILCPDSTDYLHLAGKAGHEASKSAVTYYNASFVDVS